MILEVREKINDEIQNKQEKKQKLYDEISKIDGELLELNEILVKTSDENAFFKISPEEAFEILEKLGYTSYKKKLDVYIKLISEKEEENEGYLHILENISDIDSEKDYITF